MPTLDVSDVISSPEFVTSIQVRRSTQSVASTGMASETVVSTQTIAGVVYPASGSRMVRTPEGEMITGDLSVVTRFQLTEGGGTQQADVVIWKGKEYTVMNTSDFSEFGAGFMLAICVRRSIGL